VRRLRVCLIQTRIVLGGPVWVTLGLARDLPHRGWDTLLVGGSPKRDELPLEHLPEEAGVTFRKIRALSPYITPHSDAVALIQLWRLMQRWKPDVVHTHTAKAGFLGRLAASLSGVPVVVHTYHGHAFSGYLKGLGNRAYLLLERGLARLSDALITLSPGQRDAISGEYRIAPAERFVVIPLGLASPEWVAPNSTAAEHFRTELGIPASTLLVGTVGRLAPIKNHRLFLEAAARLSQEGQSAVRYVVVGDGDLRASLEVYAEELGIRGQVVFTGYRTDMATIYAALDIVALSSDNEGTPMSLLEALASGKPVVATDVGGVRDCVPEDCGLLVPRGDSAAMAAALQALLADPHRRQAMGERGRQLMQKERSWDAMVDAHDALYRRILASKVSAENQPPSSPTRH